MARTTLANGMNYENDKTQKFDYDLDVKGNAIATNIAISNHIDNTNNPHNTTKAQVGLGNVLNVAQVNKNYIINSNFDIWQEGASFSNPLNSAYTADMCQVGYDGTGGTRTVSRQTFTVGKTDVPNNPRYYYRYSINSTGASGNTYNNALRMLNEDVTTLAGQTITLSFWARQSGFQNAISGIYFDQNFGGGGSEPMYTQIPHTAIMPTAWTKYTYTFTIPSVSGKTLGTGHHYAILIQSAAGQTYTLDITQVKLELGSTATLYENPVPSEEALRCFRYYERAVPENALCRNYNTASTTQTVASTVYFKGRKRITPTMINGVNYDINNGTAQNKTPEIINDDSFTYTISVPSTQFVDTNTFTADARF